VGKKEINVSLLPSFFVFSATIALLVSNVSLTSHWKFVRVSYSYVYEPFCEVCFLDNYFANYISNDVCELNCNNKCGISVIVIIM